MPFDARFALHTLLPLTEAAYQSLPAIMPPWEMIAMVEPNNFGYLARSETDVILALRGTQSPMEWLEDFTAIALPNSYGSGWAHVGFQRAYSRVRQSIIDGLQTIKEPLPLTIMGHSLGAALALLCAGDLARSGWKPSVYTWGGPRVGFRDFARWLETLVPSIYRIDNTWDIVCHLPSCIRGFEHAGVGVAIDGGFALGDIAHSLEFGYRPGLERLVATATAPPVLKIA